MSKPMQVLRNKKGEIIGYLKDFNGKTWLLDPKGTRKGYYDPKVDNTYKANGTVVAIKSNTLLTLLF